MSSRRAQVPWIFLCCCVCGLLGRPLAKRSAQAYSETSANKTKTRILTYPPRRDFFGSEQEIIFPEDSAESLGFSMAQAIPRLDGPPNCAVGDTYCEDFEKYPHSQLRTILRTSNVQPYLFGEDEVPTGTGLQFSNRIGENDEKFVCRGLSKTIFPKIGENKNQKWKLIINQGEEGFIQGVRIETCSNPDAPCEVLGDTVLGYTTFCRQKYMYRRLISLDKDGKPVPDTFRLPSACCCAYKVDTDFLSRFGRDFTPARKTRKKK